MPEQVYCVDSYKIFREIDEIRENLKQEQKDKISEENQENLSTFSIASDPLEECQQIDWQKNNETTPKVVNKAEKRCNDDSNSSAENTPKTLKARRSLFSDDFEPKSKFPKKGEYKLGSVYQRCFAEVPKNLHRAESDVESLTKLILYYGLDFLACAEERKELFTSVPKLGTKIH